MPQAEIRMAYSHGQNVVLPWCLSYGLRDDMGSVEAHDHGVGLAITRITACG